jgi:hypothetical protein
MLASFDYTGAAALVSALGVIVVAVLQFAQRAPVAQANAKLDHVSSAVTTGNGKTLADLADATESRRVDQLPPFAGETGPRPAPPTP